MRHELVNLALGGWLIAPSRTRGLLHADESDQDANRLGKVEHRKFRFGGNADDQIASVEILPPQAAGFVAED